MKMALMRRMRFILCHLRGSAQHCDVGLIRLAGYQCS
jgi:hypothetical protein